MRQLFQGWLQRYLGDPEAVILALFLITSIILLYTMGSMLAPVLASIVIAYLLEGLVYRCEKWKIPRWLGVLLVYLLFVGLVAVSLFVLLPLLIQQTTNLVSEIPNMVSKAQAIFLELPKQYPDYISAQQVQAFLLEVKHDVAKYGQMVVSFSIASLPSIIVLVVYLVLVPLLVFFFLWDRNKIIDWFAARLPQRRQVVKNIWGEVDIQLGNYIRGKVVEIMIVGFVTYVAFLFLAMPYTILLSVLVGLSVLIPYIGVTLVTIPVVIVGFVQWGLSSEFVTMIIIYTVICVLDANLLVPLLFSEAVNLHPVAIIVAILVFGGLWGFWGVFFAIPLATLVKAIMIAWPRHEASQV